MRRIVSNNELQATSAVRKTTRRKFLGGTAVLGAAVATSQVTLGAKGNKNSNLRILQIGAGGIGELDRMRIRAHLKAEFVGFCDVDSNVLEKTGTEFPKAFKLADYRDAFEHRLDQFDAVIIDTPDFHHAPMILTALKHRKHIYGQKPLVHQLDEMRLVREALVERPDVVTQMGNQRAAQPGRMQAVEMLRNNQLGKPLVAYVWTGALQRDSIFAAPWSPKPTAQPIPSNISWDLWNGPLRDPFNYNADDLYPRRWRTYWDTGSGQLGDWGCHLMDVLIYAFDLESPESVLTTTPRPSNTGHSAYNQSTITYAGGKRFGRKKFVVHYNDSMIRPSLASLGMAQMRTSVNQTLVVCEDGELLLGDLGTIQVFRNSKRIKHEPRPPVDSYDHWTDWVDVCLGAKKRLWSPFETALRITEPTLLSVKATRFPGDDLRWDGANYRFTNHQGANQTILKRDYREAFAPPTMS